MAPIIEIKFKRIDVTVLSFSPSKVYIRWVLEPTVLPLQNYTLNIERSIHPVHGFEPIQTVRGTTPSFIDYDVQFHNTDRNYYYRVIAHNNLTNRDIVSPIGTWDGVPDLKAMEMIRLLDWLLDDRTGTPTFVFSQISTGSSCPDCWDPATSRTTNPDCPICKGTGKVGGYYEAVLAMVDFNPQPEVTQHSGWGETQESQTRILLSAYPDLKNRDILIKATNNLTYIVDNVNNIKEPGSDTIIHQTATVIEMNRSDIETKLSIPEEVRIQAVNKMRQRKEKREW